jgi:ribonuclease P protein 1
MNILEADNCAKQLTFTFACNRMHDQPFDIHFCNFDSNSKSGRKLTRNIPTLFNADFPMNIHEESYLDIFNKRDLVYLTPHCRNELEEYNPDDIYIIGAMVDKSHNEPLSVAKAKKHGIRMAKFPLDRYYTFQGGKCLTINQVVDILLEMKNSNDWKKALSSALPRRKIQAELDDLSFEEKIEREKRKFNFRKAINNDDKKNYRERTHFDKFTTNIKTYNKKK